MLITGFIIKFLNDFKIKKNLKMANLMDLLQGQLSETLIDQLSNQLGGADRQKTEVASNLAMNTLMNALAKNASTPQGASSLLGALDKDHDGSVMDDLAGLISGTSQSKSADGMGILSHLLGGSNIFNVVEMISKGSGLNRNSSMSMLMKMAPMVLGMLGKQKRQTNMDQGGLMDFLSNSVQTQGKQNQASSLITKILDKDGDGSAMDEIAGMGMKVLGGLFKR